MWRAPIVALGLIACRSLGGSDSVDDRPLSASPGDTHPCEGETAIPAAVDEMLTRLASPVRDHCEEHRVAGAPALFVRTMNTVAHDDRGDPIPTCHWEVFRTAPEPVRHLGSVSACRFRVDGGCVVSLDDSARAAPPLCVE